MNIYPTSTFSTEYAKRLRLCKTLEELCSLLFEYSKFVQDAIVARPQTESQFAGFKEGLAMETRGEFAGEEFCERYGAVMMPEILLAVSVYAAELKVPEGLMLMRMIGSGIITADENSNFKLKK